MALGTLGTAATTSLSALAYGLGANDADVVALSTLIKDDGTGQSAPLGAFQKGGMLWVPRRGWLTMLPGDYVAIDAATGWPILVSAAAAAGAQYVHS